MSAKPRILVTSAAGKSGLPATIQLLERGYPVRAFVRRIDHRSRRLEQAGAEIFLGNQYSLVDMRAVMQGVQRAYQCAPTAPNASTSTMYSMLRLTSRKSDRLWR